MQLPARTEQVCCVSRAVRGVTLRCMDLPNGLRNAFKSWPMRNGNAHTRQLTPASTHRHTSEPHLRRRRPPPAPLPRCLPCRQHECHGRQRNHPPTFGEGPAECANVTNVVWVARLPLAHPTRLLYVAAHHDVAITLSGKGSIHPTRTWPPAKRVLPPISAVEKLTGSDIGGGSLSATAAAVSLLATAAAIRMASSSAASPTSVRSTRSCVGLWMQIVLACSSSTAP